MIGLVYEWERNTFSTGYEIRSMDSVLHGMLRKGLRGFNASHKSEMRKELSRWMSIKVM
jgi:hypothetical protein